MLFKQATVRQPRPSLQSRRRKALPHDFRSQNPPSPTRASRRTARPYDARLRRLMCTLCAGCGHDSVTAALITAFWECDVPPHMAAKLSGIGCSSKTTAYFMKQSHGFNSVHGRMPALATGANAANRDLIASASRATAIRSPSDSASSATRSGATSVALCDREQWRVRPHQGTVLRLERCGLEVEEGRGECVAADRPLPARAHAGRDLRRAHASPATRNSSCPSSAPACGTRDSR